MESTGGPEGKQVPSRFQYPQGFRQPCLAPLLEQHVVVVRVTPRVGASVGVGSTLFIAGRHLPDQTLRMIPLFAHEIDPIRGVCDDGIE